jgi:hypothetical protein
VVMAATGAGFHATVGDLEHAHLRADHGIVRPPQSDPLTQYLGLKGLLSSLRRTLGRADRCRDE